MNRKTQFGRSAWRALRRPRLEPLENRYLLSVSSVSESVALQTIADYGSALFGNAWESEVGITSKEIQQHIADDTWRTMFNGNESATVSFIREASRYLGADELQARIDGALVIANLPSIDVRELDWFRDPLVGPAIFGDYFPEPSNALSATSTESPTVMPMASASSASVSISPAAISIIEQDGMVGLSVVLNGETSDGFTVDWRTVNGSATGGGVNDPVDFVHSSGTLVFSDGEEGTSYGIGVPIKDDTLEEIDETFTVELFNLQGDGSIGIGMSTVTIIDNDPRVSIADAAPVTEADPGDAEPVATFLVTLSKSRPYSISVGWGTADGNPGDPPAFYTSDYYAAGGLVEFAPGETSKQVSVTIRNDDSHELSEYFYVNLVGGSGVVDDGQGRGRINDDDPMPTLSVNDISVDESAGTATLTVTMTGNTSLPVTVGWAAQDVLATHPADYTASAYSGTLSFPAGTGATATTSFEIVNDSLTEPDETFRLVLSNASNATIADGTGIVTIRANDPKADIDVDSNNDGTINDTDDPIEINAPGKVIIWNRDDDNGNGLFDYLDLGPLAAADNDLVPVQLALKQSGLPQATLDDLRLTLTVTQSATFVRIWDSSTKNNLINSPTTWTVGQLPNTLYMEGVANGDATLSLTLTQQSTSQTLDSDSVLVTVNYLDLTAYRPLTEGPNYGNPFQRSAVPFAEEENPGVFIRRNGDNDNGNALPDWDVTDNPVVGENDLIEVTLGTASTVAAGIRWELEKSSNDIRVWTSSTKGTQEASTTGPYPLIAGVPSTIWVEWVTAGVGPAQATLDVRLEDAVSSNVVFTDRLVFHPFTSVVIVLGGRNQVPADPIPPPDANGNSFGTFQTAIDLYREGYDVHMYDEEIVADNGTGVPYAEVVSAVQNRGVTSVAIFGYSYGGGATFLLAQGLNTNRQDIGTFSIDYTAYIDGVRNGGYLAETQSPPGTLYHLSIFQNGSFGDEFLDGGPVAGAENVNIEDDWGLAATHYTIDDEIAVRNHVKSRLRTHVEK